MATLIGETWLGHEPLRFPVPTPWSTARKAAPKVRGPLIPCPCPPTDTERTSPRMEPQIGSVLADRYRLIERLGGGGMGEVYRAEDVNEKKFCALKIMTDARARDAQLVSRLFQEARAAHRIGHPNIVEVFDAGYADGLPYLSMECLEGESLLDLLRRRKRLDAPTAVKMMLGVLAALDAAHAVDIVHRDVKPANIFVLPGGSSRIKLLDFGVAKFLERDDDSPLTESGTILGTPDYLSPEQVQGGDLVDGRSDLFSVCSVLFELLTGTPPFRGPHLVATTYRIAHGQTPRLVEHGVCDWPGLDQVLMRALSKSPDRRFSTALELARAFQQATGLSQEDLDTASSGFRFSDPPPQAFDLPIADAPSSAPSSDARTTFIAPMVRLSGRPGVPETPASGSWIRSSRSEDAPSVRGPVLRALDKAVALRFGRDIRDRALRHLSEEVAQQLLQQKLPPNEMVNLAEFDLYTHAVDELRGSPTPWDEIGRSSIELELLTELRPILRGETPSEILGGALRVWASLLNFGSWRFEAQNGEETEFLVSTVELSPASDALCRWLYGLVEQTLRTAGYPAARAQMSGASGGKFSVTVALN